MKRFLILAVLMILAVPVFAQTADQPLISATRLSLGVGANSEWNINLPGGAPGYLNQEYSAGLYEAYALTTAASVNKMPKASLVASQVFGLDSKVTRWSVGVRIALWDGGK